MWDSTDLRGCLTKVQPLEAIQEEIKAHTQASPVTGSNRGLWSRKKLHFQGVVEYGIDNTGPKAATWLS